MGEGPSLIHSYAGFGLRTILKFNSLCFPDKAELLSCWRHRDFSFVGHSHLQCVSGCLFTSECGTSVSPMEQQRVRHFTETILCCFSRCYRMQLYQKRSTQDSNFHCQCWHHRDILIHWPQCLFHHPLFFFF